MNKLKNFTINFSTREVNASDGEESISGNLDSSGIYDHSSSSGSAVFPWNGSSPVPPAQIAFPFMSDSTTFPYPKDYVLIYTDKGQFENFNLQISVEYSDTKEGGTLRIIKEYHLSSMAQQNKILTFDKGEIFKNMHFLLLPSQAYLFTIQDAKVMRSTLEGGDKLIETHEIIFKNILVDETARDFLKVTLAGINK